MRKEYLNKITNNGGVIVSLEKQADYLIADHARSKDAPAGSLSYRFIEQSIRSGKLEDPVEHPAGPATPLVREVGSSRPAKGARIPFTPEDDRVVCEWVRDCQQQGFSTAGNNIYKQLEQVVCTTLVVQQVEILTCLELETHVAVLARPLPEISPG